MRAASRLRSDAPTPHRCGSVPSPAVCHQVRITGRAGGICAIFLLAPDRLCDRSSRSHWRASSAVKSHARGAGADRVARCSAGLLAGAAVAVGAPQRGMRRSRHRDARRGAPLQQARQHQHPPICLGNCPAFAKSHGIRDDHGTRGNHGTLGAPSPRGFQHNHRGRYWRRRRPPVNPPRHGRRSFVRGAGPHPTAPGPMQAHKVRWSVMVLQT